MTHVINVRHMYTLTSKTGISAGYDYADRDLRLRGLDEVQYFETYIKMYEIPCLIGPHMKNVTVSMHECIVILMVDNLVKLKKRSDPDPGVSHSNSICTLPITLQGLPKMSSVIETWHDEAICDRSNFCACKHGVKLTKDDIDQTLFACSAAQNDMWHCYQNLVVWGSNTVWEELGQGGFQLDTLLVTATISQPQEETGVHTKETRVRSFKGKCVTYFS